VAFGFDLRARAERVRRRVQNWGLPELEGVDHVTLPVGDLQLAEKFYVGVLGAVVTFRLTEEHLRQSGRVPEGDAMRRAMHSSLTFGAGPRLDLFLRVDGQTDTPFPHPHVAFRVPPRDLLRWKARLENYAVPTEGPLRLGPEGQASLYFNDPFGNHLELVTMAYEPEIPARPPTLQGLTYRWVG
jgi:catechol 2,3-dioxygenase-like lactoylglutathione lyase family enzyme